VARIPAAEVHIDTALLHRLLTDQHPDLAAADLTVAAHGWDNVLIRIGPHLAARLPRRAAAAALIPHEQRILPRLAAHLPVQIPVPLRHGRPTSYYPWPWSVVPWLPGRHAGDLPARERDRFAPQLAAFLSALHTPADQDAPANPVRGVPLADRTEAYLSRMSPKAFPGATALRAVFERHAAAEAHSGPAVWLHGDLHPLNLLTDAGRLGAVVDFGDVTSGDPATDLATAWLTFTAAGRAAFRRSYTAPLPEATWSRARAWAAGLSATLLSHSDDHPTLAAIGRHGLSELVDAADAAG